MSDFLTSDTFRLGHLVRLGFLILVSSSLEIGII